MILSNGPEMLRYAQDVLSPSLSVLGTGLAEGEKYKNKKELC